jgi:Tfp pilus assembly protein PilW
MSGKSLRKVLVGHFSFFRDGSTLVELLVSITILTIIMGSVIGLFYTIVLHFEQSDDVTTAQQRGEMVTTLIQRNILNAGLGISGDVGVVFSGNPISAWGNSVSLASVDRTLQVIYAMPSGAVLSADLAVVAGTSVDISLDVAPSMLIDTDVAYTGAWVTFPSSPLVAKVLQKYSSTSYRIEPRTTGHLYRLGQLYHIRAMRGYAQNGSFFVEDVTLGTAKPVVEGIADVRFVLQGDNLSSWILARGNRRTDKTVSPAFFPEWSNEFGNITSEDQHYRLKVIRTVWRVRN